MWSNLGFLICLRRLFRSTAVTNLTFILGKYLYSFTRAQRVLRYYLIQVPWYEAARQLNSVIILNYNLFCPSTKNCIKIRKKESMDVTAKFQVGYRILKCLNNVYLSLFRFKLLTNIILFSINTRICFHDFTFITPY